MGGPGSNSASDKGGHAVSEYPRVLVVNGEPFWQGSSSGLTMSSLFKAWPKAKLACLFIAPIAPDLSVCDRNWQLGSNGLGLISRLIGKFTDSMIERPTLVGGNSPQLAQAGNPGAQAIRGAVSRFRRRIAGQAIRELDVYQLSEAFLNWVTELQPQVIYSPLGSNKLMKLVIDLADHCSAPVVPHFMDDWPSTHYHASMLRPVLRRILLSRLEAVLARSPERLVIGDAMADEYSRRYGGRFVPFMNAVEPALLEQPIAKPAPRKTLQLVYVGGLHLNRWRSLREIGLALKALREEGVAAEALIYSQPRFVEEARKLDLPPVMRFAGSLTPSEIPGVLRDADILLHVESFDDSSRTYTRFSVSTKIPECMCAARPILAYGPLELASICYVRDSGAGLAVGRQDHMELIAALRKLIVSEPLRESLGLRGHQVAASRHNAAIQGEQFRSILQRATTGA